MCSAHRRSPAPAAMAELQVNPMQLHFRAAVGVDAPVTLTLFNPHPVERIAFKVSAFFIPVMHRCTLEHRVAGCASCSGTCAWTAHNHTALTRQKVITTQLSLPPTDQDDRQQHLPRVAQQRCAGGGRDGACAGAATRLQGGPGRSAVRGGVPPGPLPGQLRLAPQCRGTVSARQ